MGDESKIPDVEIGSCKIHHDDFMPSPIEKQIDEDEEEAHFFLQSIRMEESLLEVNPSPAATELYEIPDISPPHMADPEEDIQIINIINKLLKEPSTLRRRRSLKRSYVPIVKRGTILKIIV